MDYSITKSIIMMNFLMYIQLGSICKWLSYYSILSPMLVLEDNEYGRLIVSNISHASPLHLLINMLSFYNLGMYFENVLGTKKFLMLIIYFALASSIIHVFIALALSHLFNYSYFYYSGSLGFSNVIFGLRYLYYLNTNQPRLIYGFLVKAKYVVWIELLLISLLMSNSSFIGHLSGILSGIILVNKYR